jgi:hypothetical protein
MHTVLIVLERPAKNGKASAVRAMNPHAPVQYRTEGDLKM